MRVIRSIDEVFATSTVPQSEVESGDICVPIAFLNDLNNADTTDGLLSVYSVWAQKLLGADRCSIALKEDANSLVVTVMNGEAGMPMGARYALHDTIIGAVSQREEMLHIPDITQLDIAEAKAVMKMGYHAAILAPIVSGDICFGTLNANFKSQIKDAPAQLALIQVMAQSLAARMRIISQMDDLNDLVLTDALTGAHNRRFLDAQAQKLWEAWTDHRSPFCVVTIDVDKFKRVNDTHGHDAGDTVLRTMVKRLMSNSRVDDHIIRLGGEEFCTLSGKSDLKDGIARARRLHTAIRQNPFQIGALALPLTISVGLSCVVSDDTCYEDVLLRADQALYQAKALGRDRIVTCGNDVFMVV
ncbi:GGDEF domain-containing protein [Yoonia sediminilitoris]|uniref:diguanylate cyclase n=1 Tax=Yoonia sediminilitoris TaxID=1286148 RepID=A0A2T6KIH2_9RHOB|nr:sensor domain-containing diguanylate cyclase [Yoonia sediminilitoris]PUB15507.1 diguanylate cyclase (GGDEF)-like protein [Yoonia sediminilitoris]RCW96116.1 diguanylate cyclase (GGDEF)-like protein [Yoonia sediminilitoris]